MRAGRTRFGVLKIEAVISAASHDILSQVNIDSVAQVFRLEPLSKRVIINIKEFCFQTALDEFFPVEKVSHINANVDRIGSIGVRRGSHRPTGEAPIADALAVRPVPGVCERQA